MDFIDERVIMQRNFQYTDVGQLIDNCTSVIYTDKTDASLIFPSCKPSAAFLILSEQDKRIQLRDLNEMIAKFQKTFKNCNIIIIGKITDGFWSRIQCSIPIERLSFYFVDNKLDAVAAIKMYVCASKANETKAEIQRKFFVQEQNQIISSNTAKLVMINALTKMGLTEKDMEIMCDMYPSIASIAAAKENEIEMNCPIDEDVSNKLNILFGATAGV